MIAIGSAIVANLQRSAIYRSSWPLLAIWSARVHGRALTRLSNLADIASVNLPRIFCARRQPGPLRDDQARTVKARPTTIAPNSSYPSNDSTIRRELVSDFTKLDGSAICQYFGHGVAEFGCVVPHCNDRIGTKSTRLRQHPLA